MNRVLVSIGPINIYWYSFLIIMAVIIGYNIIVNYSKKVSDKTSYIMDMTLGVVISAIIGARLYYVIFNFDVYQDDLLEIFMIWNGGLAIYGAIIGGMLYALYYCKKKDMNFIKLLDIFSLSLLLGQAIGRWGNFFNSEAYGGKTTYDALASMHIPKFIIDGMYIDGFYRVPTFLYESLWCLLGVVILFIIRMRDRYINGRQIGFYFIWYGIGRFFIEGLRSDSLYMGSFRISQIVSVILIIVGVIMMLISYFNNVKKKNNHGGDIFERV